MPSILMCPVCQQCLHRSETTYACASGHSFDIAREGYANLLLAHHRHSAEPGDSREMVASRRAFLEGGHYEALANALHQTIAHLCRHPPADEPLQILDAGCGEGHYLWKLAASLKAENLLDRAGLWGVDISRPAVKAAARRDKTSTFAVGSTYRLPVLPASVHVLCSAFAPFDAEEFRRVLKSGGWLLTLGPGPRHLASLKALVYATPQEHPAESPMLPGFARAQQTRIACDLRLCGEAVGHLLRMTPYYWHMDKRTQEGVLSLGALETEIDVALALYQKL